MPIETDDPQGVKGDRAFFELCCDDDILDMVRQKKKMGGQGTVGGERG